MRLLLPCAMTVTVVGWLFAAPAHAQETRQEAVKNGWMFDLTRAKRLAESTNKPLMVVFRCEP